MQSPLHFVKRAFTSPRANRSVDSDCSRLLLVWLAVRTAVWVLLVILTQPNAPLDVIELLGWGNAWQAGYPKHPPLSNWIAAAAARLSPGEVWGVHLISYMSTACCLWSVWQIGRLYLPPRVALLCALSLDGLIHFGGDGAEWNNNVALNLGWALTAWFGFKACATSSVKWWLAAGAAAGLALLMKYTAVVHLAPVALYLVLSPRGRRQLAGPGPWAAAAIALAMFAPHVVWVAGHDFTTLRFAASRTIEVQGWHTHITNPALFLLHQAVLLIPMLFILWPLAMRRSDTAALPETADPWLLRAVAIGPVAMFVLYGVVTGCQLRDIWGATFWTHFGVWILAELGWSQDPAAISRAFRRWVLVAAAMWAFAAGKAVLEPHLTGKQTRATFPGKPLAKEVNRRWNEQFERPFGVAAGEAWLCGNIACFSGQRPTMFTDWSVNYPLFEPARSPWTGDDDMRRRGGVIVWPADLFGDELPAYLHARFPDARVQPPVVLPYQTRANVSPVRVGLAFIPPRSD